MKVKFGAPDKQEDNVIHMPPMPSSEIDPFHVEVLTLNDLVTNLQLYVSALPLALKEHDSDRTMFLLRAIAGNTAEMNYTFVDSGFETYLVAGPGDDNEDETDENSEVRKTGSIYVDPSDTGELAGTSRRSFSNVARPSTEGGQASGGTDLAAGQPHLEKAYWNEGDATRDYVNQ